MWTLLLNFRNKPLFAEFIFPWGTSCFFITTAPGEDGAGRHVYSMLSTDINFINNVTECITAFFSCYSVMLCLKQFLNHEWITSLMSLIGRGNSGSIEGRSTLLLLATGVAVSLSAFVTCSGVWQVGEDCYCYRHLWLARVSLNEGYVWKYITYIGKGERIYIRVSVGTE